MLKNIEMEETKHENQMHEEEGALGVASKNLHKPKSILSTLINMVSFWIRLGLGLLFLQKIRGRGFAAVGRFGFRAGCGIWIRVGSLFPPCSGFVWDLSLWHLCCCMSLWLAHFNMELECVLSQVWNTWFPTKTRLLLAQFQRAKSSLRDSIC